MWLPSRRSSLITFGINSNTNLFTKLLFHISKEQTFSRDFIFWNVSETTYWWLKCSRRSSFTSIDTGEFPFLYPLDTYSQFTKRNSSRLYCKIYIVRILSLSCQWRIYGWYTQTIIPMFLLTDPVPDGEFYES